MNRLFTGLAALTLVGAAQAQLKVNATPAPYTQFISDYSVNDGMDAVYVNTAPSHLFYAPGQGKTVADDLHLQHGGWISSFDFAYYDSGQFGQVNAKVDFLKTNGAHLATFELNGLIAAPKTAFGVRVGLAGTGLEFLAPQDILMQLSFSRSTTGWVLGQHPFSGSSQDRFLANGHNAWFGGTPKANFYADIHAGSVDPHHVIVPEPSTLAALAAAFTGVLGLRRRR